MSETGDSEPKIIVDDDWKEQVAREKEAAALKAKAEVEESTTAPTKADDDAPELPPEASFEMLITMLFTQAMAMLGQIPNPASGKAEINKPFAKHYIDTLEMLGEKTKGNLSETESKMLAEALHALRMTFVSVRQT